MKEIFFTISENDGTLKRRQGGILGTFQNGRPDNGEKKDDGGNCKKRSDQGQIIWLEKFFSAGKGPLRVWSISFTEKRCRRRQTVDS